MLATELGYFRRNRSRMGYAAAKALGLSIGSGVVDAACKTLAPGHTDDQFETYTLRFCEIFYNIYSPGYD